MKKVSIGRTLFEHWMIEPVSGWSRADWVETHWDALTLEDRARWEELAQEVVRALE